MIWTTGQGRWEWEVRRISYAVWKFHELWSTNALNWTGVFTHPP